MNRKSVALILSIVMILSSLLTAPAVSSAATKGKNSLTATRGVYWFDPHLAGKDLTDTYIYDDALLKGDSLKLSWPLAAMTYELAVASISSEREPKTQAGYANKSRNLRAYLEDNGFVDFDTNEDYKKKMTTRTMGVACAHKKIKDGGENYTLLAIVPRSAGYEAEWGGNFMLGEEGDHEGFRIGKVKVLSFAREYIKKYGIKGNIKVWTAGYSRGAGVTNQVGAEIIRNPKEALGSSITLKRRNFYCYTYGTPNSAGTDGDDYEDSKFDYIHNLWQSYDITTVVPFAVLGFSRYGKNFTYADKGDKERMLELCESLNKLVYDSYTTEGDPDVFFKPKKLDVNALITSRELKFVDDDESYLPKTQTEFAQLLANTAEPAFGTRTEYVARYQDAIEEMGGYYYSHLEKGDQLVDGIMKSKLAIPTVIAAYIAYMTERYKENTISAEDKENLEKWLAELKEIINEAEASGAEIPQDVLDQAAELEAALRKANKLSDLVDIAWTLTGLCCSYTLGEGLTEAGLPEEDKELYDRLTSNEYCRAYARTAAYFLLYDELQTEGITFSYLSQQFKHLATLVGNAGSYQRPHNNEIILSWLRTIDPSYDDFRKENTAQISGYRRLYIKQPKGVTVTGTVKTAAGKTVAKFKNGRITSRSDKWIGITTCDKGNWLRLPVDKTYKVELRTSKKATLNLKAAEYDVYEGKVVRTVTKDKKYNWKKLTVRKSDKVTWVISKVSGKEYKLPSKAYYYIKKTSNATRVLVARGTATGRNKIRINWNKVIDADRYVIYMSACSDGERELTPKKVKTVKGGTQKWTTKALKKASPYKFYVVAKEKVNGKYKTILKSKEGHVVTGNASKAYTNPKSLTLNKTKVTLKKGKTFRIRGKVTKIKADKKLMTSHVKAKLRFVSEKSGIAKVSASGKVTAVSAGKCRIYVQAPSGMWKTLTVTVK